MESSARSNILDEIPSGPLDFAGFDINTSKWNGNRSFVSKVGRERESESARERECESARVRESGRAGGREGWRE